MSGGVSQSQSSRRRNQSAETDTTNCYNYHHQQQKSVNHRQYIPVPPSSFQNARVYPVESREYYRGMKAMGQGTHGRTRQINRSSIRVDTGDHVDDEPRQETTPVTLPSTPTTPPNVRGSRDLRSPGEPMTPVNQVAKVPSAGQGLPDFITQTDANGNATTPRSSEAIQGAKQYYPNGSKPKSHDDKRREEDGNNDSLNYGGGDGCEALFENLRMMCCCLVDDHHMKLSGVATEDSDQPIKLLGPMHPDDAGKKCLVLDLDETLVHSSFRAVPNADFVIPVQIEDVVHFVYVAKRPGVDEFLVEMAKHYEIVIYTASLNKYADPLLDLLDPQKTIRARLFRESCAYFEGNYVKDLSLLNRDLSDTIIIDNSPASYMFHPENAIDCSSFIDDRNERELYQIGAFLTGIKDVKDVRGIANQWREWPVIKER